MQKEIIQKIELLVEMADSNSVYDSLSEELRIVELDIAKLKDSINDLTKSMVDAKYMRASDRIIDENIKISLENKLSSYHVSLKEIQKKIQGISLEEEEFHQQILELEEEIATSQKFLDSLEMKLKTIGSKDKSVYSFYEELIDVTTKEIQANKSKLDVKKKAIESIQQRLESYADSRVALEEKINKDSLQLEATIATLSNPKAYINENAREQDEENIKKMNESLKALETRQLEILNDPTYLGHEAKDFVLSDDRTSALGKIKSLVSIVLSKPYMDFQLDELDEALEEAILKRDEFANLLENKKYDGTENEVLENRIQFLKLRYEELTKEKESLEKKIKDMDTRMVKLLMESISSTKKVRDELKSDIEQYKKVMEENNEFKTPKKKASLSAAFHRKCEELEQVNHILSSYEKDLEDVVTKSKVLEETDYMNLIHELREIEEEIQEFDKKKLLHNLPQDILAMEKDKSELKKLSDNVEAILQRKKYSKTPKQLFDELELSLGTMGYADSLDSSVEESPIVSDYRIDEADTDLEVPVVDESIPEEPLSDEVEMDDILEPEIPDSTFVEPISEIQDLDFMIEPQEEEVKEYSPRVSKPVNSRRLQVISVEPIDEETSSSANSEEDYMINDFQDTDYISFNDLLEGGK